MSNRLQIGIGAKGIFTLATPYDALLQINTTYECKGIRKLSDIIAFGTDPYEKFYEPQNISRQLYEEDLAVDVSVISLCSATGQWVYVPSTSVIKYPIVNGVTYTAVVLGISLGAIPDTLLLDPLKTSITNLVTNMLGVDSEVKEVVVSPPAILPYDDHVIIDNARVARQTIFLSDSALLAKANIDLVAARAKIVQLEAYIKGELGLPPEPAN
jgi:hypothetical protein